MKVVLTTALVALLAVSVSQAASPAMQYKVTERYKIAGGDRYDFIRFDQVGRQLYVAHSTRVEVLDGDTGRKIGEIPTDKDVRGIAIASEFKHGFTSNALARSVTMFDLDTLKPLRSIRYTGVKPDAIDYDPQSKRVFVANGDSTGDITVIAAATGDIVGTVNLGAKKLEMMAFDGAGRGFINDEVQGVVFVFDTHTLAPIAKWSVAPGEEPTGLAIDRKNHRLFASCNGKLVVLDSDKGNVVATLPIAPDPDGTLYEASTQRIFSPGAGGTLSVIQQQGPDQYSVVQSVPTEEGAKTLTLDEKTGRVFLPVGKYGLPAKGAPDPRPTVIPGTFTVIVVGR